MLGLYCVYIVCYRLSNSMLITSFRFANTHSKMCCHLANKNKVKI